MFIVIKKPCINWRLFKFSFQILHRILGNSGVVIRSNLLTVVLLTISPNSRRWSAFAWTFILNAKAFQESHRNLCTCNNYPFRNVFVRIRYILTDLMKLNFCIDFLTDSSIAQITIVVLLYFYEEVITRKQIVFKFVVYKFRLGISLMFVIFPLQTIFYTLCIGRATAVQLEEIGWITTNSLQGQRVYDDFKATRTPWSAPHFLLNAYSGCFFRDKEDSSWSWSITFY